MCMIQPIHIHCLRACFMKQNTRQNCYHVERRNEWVDDKKKERAKSARQVVVACACLSLHACAHRTYVYDCLMVEQCVSHVLIVLFNRANGQMMDALILSLSVKKKVQVLSSFKTSARRAYARQ